MVTLVRRLVRLLVTIVFQSVVQPDQSRAEQCRCVLVVLVLPAQCSDLLGEY